MREKKISLPPDQEDEYTLINTLHYGEYYGWKAGDKLIRKSIWLSGNGCGVRQAYFECGGREGTAWQDHVEPLLGQKLLFVGRN